ncbi:MAG TPA: hypothetical protein VES36_00580, partial [Candidatus Limnocylindrales bacterium]|nr:hypothetical protein [Candidatus Limnocylindrales bacterium]
MSIQNRSQGRWLAPLGILALVMVACSGGSGASSATVGQSQSAQPEPDELLVLEWDGYQAADFFVDFTAASPSTSVEFEIGANDADILARMQAGSEADVFHFYTGW